MILVFLAGLVTNWRQALLIVQPETLLKWHRTGFKLFWKFKSRAKSRKPKIAQETILLIKKMASENRLWGAERIQGELLKLNIKVSKRTIQKYMHQAKPPRSSTQNWATFLKNHADQIWACDFLPVNDIFFRQLYAFVIVELGSRKIIHVGVTAHPTDEWTRLGYIRRPRTLQPRDGYFACPDMQSSHHGALIKLTPIIAYPKN